MDCSTKFLAEVQTTLRNEYCITPKFTTARNPQANAMVEHAHQTIHNMIANLDLRGKSDVKGGLNT